MTPFFVRFAAKNDISAIGFSARRASAGLCVLLCTVASCAGAQEMAPAKTGITAQQIDTAHLDAAHVLNRLAFGPRPGEIDAVARQGVRIWISAQLQPEKIDDSAVEAKLQKLPTLKFDGPQLILAYESSKAFGKERRQGQATDAKTATMLPAKLQAVLDEARKAGLKPGMEAETVGEMATSKLVRAVESPRQLQEVLVDFWTNHFNLDVNKGPVRTLRVADERDAIRPFVFGKFRALLGASAHSPAMLVYLDNAKSTREMPVGVRPRLAARRALRNADLAVATPVVAAPAGGAATPLPAPAPAKRGGVNENYARELMELHTMGVNGGYTQADVQEVARCFTGWSINKDGTYVFRKFAHDDGEKTVLGHVIPAGGGERDGEMVLDILAAHPSTAKFIARKLVRRLVNDNPPAALVDRATQTFLRTGGDLREVTQTIVLSPEFFAPANRRAKIKSPFEFAVSAVRAMDGAVWVPDPELPRQRQQLLREGRASLGRGDRGSEGLASAISAMGQPLFAFSAPTGYSEDSQTWVSTGGLVARLNFALNLSGGNVINATVDRARLFEHVDLNDADAIVDRLNERILGGLMTAATRATLEQQAGATPDPNKLLALTLGSPEFQRR